MDLVLRKALRWLDPYPCFLPSGKRSLSLLLASIRAASASWTDAWQALLLVSPWGPTRPSGNSPAAAISHRIAHTRPGAGHLCRQDRPVQTAAPQVQHRSSSPSFNSTPRTLGANAGRDALELSSLNTTTITNQHHTTLVSGCALPCLHVSCPSPSRDIPHTHTLRLDGTRSALESVQTLQTILHSSVRHAARHVTSRQDSTQTFPYHSSCRSACLTLCFCRLPFPPPAPHPPVVPESAGSNHYRFLPTKKSAVATHFFFSFSPGNSVFYFRPARPLNRVLPLDLQLHSVPTLVGTGLCNRAGRPVPVSWGMVCARGEAERAWLRL